MAVRRDGEALHWLGAASRDGAVGGLGDGELIARFGAGPGLASDSAFEVLVRRHGPQVLARCRGIVRDEHDAEDAFQATFLVLARQAASIRDPDRLAPWLDRVARRIALQAREDVAGRRTVEGGRIDPAITPTSSPERPALVADETATLVRAAVDRLPEPDRRLMQLTYWQGKTYQEAATLLRWPIGTVRSRLARARDRLKRTLARVGPTTGLIPGGPIEPTAVLVARTVRAAAGCCSGNLAAIGGVVPAAVVALVEWELTMKLITGKSIIALLVVGGVMTAGTASLAWRGAAVTPAPAAPTAQAATIPPPAAKATPNANIEAGERDALAGQREDWARRLAGPRQRGLAGRIRGRSGTRDLARRRGLRHPPGELGEAGKISDPPATPQGLASRHALPAPLPPSSPASGRAGSGDA